MSKSDNVLLPGKLRTGTLISDNPLFDSKQVTVEATEAGIEITVFWETRDPVASFWFGHLIPNKDPVANEHLHKIPRNLWFADAYGSIALLNCYAIGRAHMGGYGSGKGTIIAKSAIMGAKSHSDYQHVYGLRTSIVGLRQWIGKSSVNQNPHCNETDNFESWILSFRRPRNITLCDHPPVCIHLSYSVSTNADIWTISDKAYIETRSNEPLTWQRAELLHRALQNLLRISSGEDRDLTESLVLRSSNPVVNAENNASYEEWLPITHGIREHHKPRHHNCLIPYEKLKEESLQKWFSLYEEIPRAIDPLITSFTLNKVTAEVRLLEASSGMEALGYYLLKSAGKNKKDASSISFKSRLELISNDLEDILPFDVSDWIQQTSSAYNGVKHANREA